MKYFLDTEFLEGSQKEKFPISLFRKQTPNTIDLISIGIVSEDGREYYAISKDFNLKEAWNRFDLKETEYTVGFGFNAEKEIEKVYWLRENVLKPIFFEWKLNNNSKIVRLRLPVLFNEMPFNYKNFKYCIKCIGKSNNQIAEEIKAFCLKVPYWHIVGIGEGSSGYSGIPNFITKSTERYYDNKKCREEINSKNAKKHGLQKYDVIREEDNNPEFYAYYADYDWVVFCWLFGKMIDLPEGFPKYCRDLKQILDEKLTGDMIRVGATLDARELVELRVMETLEERLSWLKKQSIFFPKQDPSKSDNAIEDARWNKLLYEFLNTL